MVRVAVVEKALVAQNLMVRSAEPMMVLKEVFEGVARMKYLLGSGMTNSVLVVVPYVASVSWMIVNINE